MMRLLAAIIAVGLAALTGMTSRSASSADARTVPCAEPIAITKFPYVGSSRPENRYRQLLGVVSVPPAYMRQVVPTGQKPWAYWHKQGLVLRATGQLVTVTVPKRLRTRAAITWGSSEGPVSSLRIQACKTAANVGNAYAGGFLLRSRAACITLIFSVGRRSTAVRFGLGQRCSR